MNESAFFFLEFDGDDRRCGFGKTRLIEIQIQYEDSSSRDYKVVREDVGCGETVVMHSTENELRLRNYLPTSAS